MIKREEELVATHRVINFDPSNFKGENLVERHPEIGAVKGGLRDGIGGVDSMDLTQTKHRKSN